MKEWKLEPAQDLGLPLGQRLRSLRRESGLLQTAAHLGWWAVVRTYLGGFHRLTIHGREHIPTQPPFIIVANHVSHLDALVLASPLPWNLRDRIFPIAAGDTFFDKPILAFVAAGMLNALPLWRKRVGPGALQELRRRLLEEPCAYILFPEGTRSRDGKIGHFKPGLGMLVAETDVPVVPCYLQGTFQALPPHRVWPRFHKIALEIGEPLLFTGIKNDRPGWEEIARVTEATVRKLGDAIA